jgi:diacylglycerol kinase family enzyme
VRPGRHIVVVRNPGSRRDKKMWPLIQKALVGLDYRMICGGTKAQRQWRIRRAALRCRGTIFVVSGGDGTINETVQPLITVAYTEPVLAPAPSGGGNDLVRHLTRRLFPHMGWSPDDFRRAILTGKTSDLDLLRIKDASGVRWAVAYLGIGLTGESVKHMEKRPKASSVIGRSWRALKALFTSRPVLVREGKLIKRWTSITLHNGSAIAEFLVISRKSRLDDGRFELLRVRSRLFGRLRVLLLGIFAGVARGLPGLPSKTVLKLKLAKRTVAQHDGEPFELEEGEVEVESVRVGIKMLDLAA